MTYIVHYNYCGRWFTEDFTEAEFEQIFDGKATDPSMSWMIV